MTRQEQSPEPSKLTTSRQRRLVQMYDVQHQHMLHRTTRWVAYSPLPALLPPRLRQVTRNRREVRQEVNIVIRDRVGVVVDVPITKRGLPSRVVHAVNPKQASPAREPTLCAPRGFLARYLFAAPFLLITHHKGGLLQFGTRAGARWYKFSAARTLEAQRAVT